MIWRHFSIVCVFFMLGVNALRSEPNPPQIFVDDGNGFQTQSSAEVDISGAASDGTLTVKNDLITSGSIDMELTTAIRMKNTLGLQREVLKLDPNLNLLIGNNVSTGTQRIVMDISDNTDDPIVEIQSDGVNINDFGLQLISDQGKDNPYTPGDPGEHGVEAAILGFYAEESDFDFVTMVRTPGTVDEGDVLGTILVQGFDGGTTVGISGIAGTSAAAFISFLNDGPILPNVYPGRIEFATTRLGDGQPTTSMTIKQDGKIGIGINAGEPKNLLDVEAGVAIGAAYTGSDGKVAPTDGLIVQGKVGIGTSNPTQLLEVVGQGAAILVDSGGDSKVIIDSKNDSNVSEVQFLTDASFNWALGRTKLNLPSFDGDEFFIGGTSGGDAADLVIETNGNVGIGILNPSTKLDVNGSIAGANLSLTGTLAANGTGDSVIAGKTAIGTTGPKSQLDVEGGVAIGADYSGGDGTAAPANGLIVEGKVGVGTDAPNNPLEIASGSNQLRITNTDAGTNHVIHNMIGAAYDINVMTPSNTDNALVRLFRDTVTTGTVTFAVMRGNGGGIPNHLLAGNGDSYLSRFTGKVGIGTYTPDQQLDVAGAIQIRNEVPTGEPPENAFWIYSKLGQGFAKENGMTASQITSHKDPRNVDPTAQTSFQDLTVDLPFSFHHSNGLIGKGAIIDTAKMVAYIEQQMQTELGAEAGRLVYMYDLPSSDTMALAEWEDNILDYQANLLLEELDTMNWIKVELGPGGDFPPEAIVEVPVMRSGRASRDRHRIRC